MYPKTILTWSPRGSHDRGRDSPFWEALFAGAAEAEESPDLFARGAV